MKTVTFIKDHPVGIKEGRTITVQDHDAQRWHDQGYVDLGEDAGQDEPEMIDHTVTKKDLKENPTWVGMGHKVGQVIQVPNPKFIQ